MSVRSPPNSLEERVGVVMEQGEKFARKSSIAQSDQKELYLEWNRDDPRWKTWWKQFEFDEGKRGEQ